jgi:hypothetical protein
MSAGGRTLQEYDASMPPYPEPYGGASLATAPEDQEAALDVLENNHFTNSMSRACPGAIGLSA